VQRGLRRELSWPGLGVTVNRSSCSGIFPFVAFNHMTRTLCMCATTPAMSRPFFGGGSARHASAGRFSSRYWVMRSLVSKAESRASVRTKGAAAFLGMAGGLPREEEIIRRRCSWPRDRSLGAPLIAFCAMSGILQPFPGLNSKHGRNGTDARGAWHCPGGHWGHRHAAGADRSGARAIAGRHHLSREEYDVLFSTCDFDCAERCVVGDLVSRKPFQAIEC
jgi:hypothetical protein